MQAQRIAKGEALAQDKDLQGQDSGALKDAHRRKSEQTPEARRIRELESELRRKEKALAEAAALLILKKKLDAYLEERDNGTNTRRGT